MKEAADLGFVITLPVHFVCSSEFCVDRQINVATKQERMPDGLLALMYGVKTMEMNIKAATLRSQSLRSAPRV